MIKCESGATVALVIPVPEQVGWAVQAGDDNWSGSGIGGLLERLAEGVEVTTVTVSLVLEIGEADGPV